MIQQFFPRRNGLANITLIQSSPARRPMKPTGGTVKKELNSIANYRYNHRDQACEYCRLYLESHRNQIRLKQKAYRGLNLESILHRRQVIFSQQRDRIILLARN